MLGMDSAGMGQGGRADGIGTRTVRALRRIPPPRWATPAVVLRLLALLGAALYAYAAYGPWIIASPYDVDGPATIVVLLLSQIPRLLDSALVNLVGFAASGVMVLGLLLAPLLWMRAAGAGSRLARWAFAAWALLAALFTMAGVAALLVDLSRRRAVGPVESGRAPGWGLLVAILALAAIGCAAVALLRERTPAATTPTAPDARRGARGWGVGGIAGASLISVGVTLWALGFLALPWATVGCDTVPLTVNHFILGSCTGLDAGDVLGYLPQPWPPTAFDATFASPALGLYELLAGGGVLVLAAIWRGAWQMRLASAGRIWVAVWLGVASLAAAITTRGVSVVLAVRPRVSSSAVTGMWQADMGLLICVLGLVIGWLGLALLDVTLRHAVATRRAMPARPSQS